MTTEAQKRALAAYRERNRGQPRMPGVTISEHEASLLERMSEKYGSKKAAIIAGLEKLRDEE